MTAEYVASQQALDRLADRFWAWRAHQKPCSGDDIPRLERPDGWVPAWSAADVARYRRELAEFEGAFERTRLPGAPVESQVDRRLLGSAIARVRWELEIQRSWRHDPGFYLDQSLGALFTSLLAPPPFDRERTAAVLALVAAIPVVLADGRRNLSGQVVAAFARSAATRLEHAARDLLEAMAALRPFLASPENEALEPLTEAAVTAIGEFRHYVLASRDSACVPPAARPDAYRFLLGRVALLPYTPAELTAMAGEAFDRAVASEALERHRNGSAPPARRAPDLRTQLDRQGTDETGIRRFYRDHRLITLPDDLPRYTGAAIPPYLEPLTSLGIVDDLASPSRMADDRITYVPPPAEDLPYFDLANAMDPRLGIAHEGAHAHQLALSWRNPRPARRHYYDSAPNEGIACYNEELLLACGLYHDNPHAARQVYSFMRLRALRVMVDVGLAAGTLSLAEAAGLLEERTPMDHATAAWEAVFFTTTPGQAISYQVGKTQVLGFVADAARRAGTAFDLRACHDYLWRNGNVPISLLRWEYLGDRDALDRADALASEAETPA